MVTPANEGLRFIVFPDTNNFVHEVRGTIALYLREDTHTYWCYAPRMCEARGIKEIYIEKDVLSPVDATPELIQRWSLQILTK